MELIRYFDNISTDPAIKRLCDLAFAYAKIEEDLDVREELVIDEFSILDIIKERNQAQDLVEELKDEICTLENKLEAQTVLEVMNELRAQLQTAIEENKDIQYRMRQIEKNEQAAKERLEMWGKLNADYSRI